MRRIVGYELLLFAVAGVLVAGCSTSSSPEVTDAGDRSVDIVLPDASEATPLTGDAGAAPPRLADAPSAASSGTDPEIPERADSDTPGAYQPPAADKGDDAPQAHAHVPTPGNEDAEAPKRNGRSPDGDDPAAPLIVAKVIEQQDDTPLNNGRAPSAKPLPEGQRVAVERKDVDGDLLNSGRAPGAKPGDKVADAAPAKATSKPAAPTRKTLADVSESIQALDKNSDGQLGLSEWPRDKLSEFKTLDGDNDGFLTPAELIAGQKKKKSAADGQKEAPEKPTKTTDKADPKEKATTTTDDESAKSEDDKAPAAETTDDQEAASDTSADEADSEDDAKADSEAEPGTP